MARPKERRTRAPNYLAVRFRPRVETLLLETEFVPGGLPLRERRKRTGIRKPTPNP